MLLHIAKVTINDAAINNEVVAYARDDFIVYWYNNTLVNCCMQRVGIGRRWAL